MKPTFSTQNGDIFVYNMNGGSAFTGPEKDRSSQLIPRVADGWNWDWMFHEFGFGVKQYTCNTWHCESKFVQNNYIQKIQTWHL